MGSARVRPTRGPRESPRTSSTVLPLHSIRHTFYRRHNIWRELFERNGLVVRFVSLEHPRLERHRLLAPVVKLRLIGPILEWALLNFRTIQMLVIKGDATLAPSEVPPVLSR